ITVAVEGDVDEAVARRIVKHVGLELGPIHGRRGKPHLLQCLRAYNNAARFGPWFVLVDLDGDCPCARGWLPAPSDHMCFRVVVREVEAWLLADRDRVASVLAVGRREIPANPDSLERPKIELVNLARRSRSKAVREGLVPREGSGRSVGALYTTRLVQF